jgi:hypothetical protein
MASASKAGARQLSLVNSIFINNLRLLRRRAAALAVRVPAERDELRAAQRTRSTHFHDQAGGRVTKSGTSWRTDRYAPQA